jgi:hypothetical protein
MSLCHSQSHDKCVKYLDINSSFRNRNQYPNPADFVIPIGMDERFVSICNDNCNSTLFFQDPVLTSVPYTQAKSTNPPLKTQVGSTFTKVVLDPREVNIYNYYIGSFLNIGNEYRQIIQYNKFTFVATVDSAFSVSTSNVFYYIRKSVPTLITNIIVNIAEANYMNQINKMYFTSSIATNQNGSYEMLYFRFINGSLINTIYKILKYDGSTKLCTFEPGFNVSQILGGGLDQIEISRYTFNNSESVYYRTLGPTNVRFYELSMQYLCLPNLTVCGNNGGLLDSYPYVDVHLYNDGFQQTTNVMYSNNPNSSQAVFKIPIDKYLYNRPTNFYTLKPINQFQVIPFNPGQNLRFRIVLPNGTTLKYTTSDTFSPSAPNPLVQISAQFAIKPVANYDVNTCSATINLDF